MEEYIDKFVDYIRIQRNYSSHTETNYLLDLEDYESYIKQHRINFKNIDYKNITIYTKYLKEEKKLNSTSINRHLSSLRSFYNFLVRESIIESNPFKLIKGPKNPIKLPNYMKYSEFEMIIDACGDDPLGIRNRAIFELLLATGARIGEIINLKINDIDFSTHEIRVLGKGNKQRICYFNDHAAVALEEYINDSRVTLLNGKPSDYLLINHIGTKLTDRGVRSILDNVLKKCALTTKVTPHTFRHTFATLLLNEGCDLKSVQELLGHVNMSTTSIYTHVTNDRIKDIYLHAHPRSRK